MNALRKLVALVGAFLVSTALAQTYPYTTPTYTPTAALAPVALSAAGDPAFVTNNVSTVTLRVTGTCTGLTAAFQGTNDGTNYTTVPVVPVAGGSAITSITGTGFWRANTAGFTKARVHVTVLSAACTFAMAGSAAPTSTIAASTGGSSTVAVDQTTDGTTNKVTLTNAQTPIAAATATATNGVLIGGQYDSTQKTLTNGQQAALSASARGALMVATGADAFNVVTTQTSTVGDPCQNPSVLKSSAVVNIGAAATTKIVDTSASTVIYVCSFSAALAGTTPTVQFKTGTHVTNDCDTAPASLSGAYAPVTGTVINGGSGGTLMKSIAGGQVCATTVGTGSSFQGVLSYVQQ